MNVRGTFTADKADQGIAAALREALIENALPGEVEGLSDEDLDRIVTFVTETARERQPGEPALRLISSGLNVDGRRRMRLASHPILGDSSCFQERPPVLQIMVRLPSAI